MNTTQFLKELSKINRRYWKEVPYFRYVHADSPPERHELRRTTPYRCYCPVTAVAHAKTGKFYDICNFREAARAIGLKSNDYCRIIEAADGNAHLKLREKLLKAVGLSEHAS